ncbi:MAG TPA: ABC transporter permease, partial [Gemmatimonadales bacterium]|nr:ABC transporter permease [Gemmatimonadales bacterium]
ARNRLLFHAFYRREIFTRYVGSASGVAWALLSPLAQLAILSFVFSQIFRIAGGVNTGGLGYTAFVAVALWPWLAFSESVSRGLGAITANGDLVRKVSFPHLLLVLASVAASYTVILAGYIAVLAVLAWFDPALRLSGLPVVAVLLVPHFILSVGVAAAMAALQTFLRDVAHVVGILLSLLFYATPVLYSASMVPESVRAVMALNPHAYFSERFRAALTGHASLASLDVQVALGCVAVAALCAWFFVRLSPHFEELV